MKVKVVINKRKCVFYKLLLTTREAESLLAGKPVLNRGVSISRKHFTVVIRKQITSTSK